jgi:hypothetical protein
METTFDSRVAELEAELAEAKRLQRDAEKAAAESVVPVYAYSLELADQTERIFNRVRDDAVVVYRVVGVCTNQAEVDAVRGKSFTGSMCYFFNTATGKFIMASGGGTVFIQDGSYRYGQDIDDSVRVWKEMDAFAVANPNGGDITKIITDHHARKSGQS